MSRRLVLALCTLTGAVALPADGRDWTHWRGPEGTGQSREKNLPDSFGPNPVPMDNVIWKAPYGGRSAPLVMAGRVYILQGTGAGLEEAEQVVCVDEKTGKPLWTYRVNVFHTDIVSTRVGWAPLTADPSTGTVYVQTTGGLLLALDEDGKLVWQHSLTEEYGRASGYGGRLPAPIYDSGLVIAPMVSSSWGDFARGTNRFVAFDAKTGDVVWWHDTANPSKETYCSHPVVGVIGGQRVLVSGGADGFVHAVKVRTGEKVWSLQICSGAVNGSPVIDGNLVYCGHGDENPGGGPYGRVICVDGSEVDPVTMQPKVVWDSYNKPFKVNRNKPLTARFGLASPALADGVLFCPDDTGDLYGFDAKTGDLLWKYHYATEVRGSPLVADGKIYIMDVKSRMLIIDMDGKPKNTATWNTFEYRFREPRGVYTETNGTPIAVNGHVYFVSAASLWCIGDPKAQPACDDYKEPAPETPFNKDAKPASVRVFPADVVAKPGDAVKFSLVYLDANGRELTAPGGAAVEWSAPFPPKTPAGAQPPALQGNVQGAGGTATVTLTPVPSQQGILVAKSGNLTARARVRVAPRVGFKQDFEKLPDGASPGGWVNANGKFSVKKLPDGNTVLAKGNTDPRPPLAKANAFLTLPSATGYTIEADLMGTVVNGGMADFGVVNNRYSLVLDGKTDPDLNSRTVRLVAWEARPRIDQRIKFDWQPNVWYTARLVVEVGEKAAVVRGKVWEKGKPEPTGWTVEFTDPSPNREGSAGLYGYVTNATVAGPGADAYYDNISITPNK